MSHLFSLFAFEFDASPLVHHIGLFAVCHSLPEISTILCCLELFISTTLMMGVNAEALSCLWTVPARGCDVATGFYTLVSLVCPRWH
jgi:hypothetical protein